MAKYAVTMLSGKNSIVPVFVPVFVPNYCPRRVHARITHIHARARSGLVGPSLDQMSGRHDSNSSPAVQTLGR